MYHPKVIQSHIAKLEEAYKLEAVEYSIDQVSAWTDQLSDAVDDKGVPKRPLTKEETAFIQNEVMMTKSSFKYWAERYAFINIAGQGIDRMYPLLPSQNIIINEIGRLEYAGFNGEHQDGILINLLKGGRQMGGSTVAECILAHRSTTQDNLQGLIGSDVPGEDGSGYLFGMFERIVDNLPWFLRPKITERVKNTEIAFDGGTHVWVGAGKSTRGTTGKRGQLGRGKSLSLIHLSELSTWEAVDQIDSALMPTVPYHPRTFVLFESTAKGQNNWWHKHWKISRDSKASRFVPIFIPWYAEPTRYSLNPPADWIPADSTLAYAKRAEELGPRWVHRRVNLTKEQLYWYEFTRSTYEAKDDLRTFLEEFGAVDDEECFQFTGKSIFPLPTIQRIVDKAKPILAVLEIAPQDVLLPPSEVGGPVELPPGFGVRILPRREWQGLLAKDDGLDELQNYLLIWEPRRNGFQYVMSGDVSDGIGLDRSVCDITRIATIKEPDEQVAQFVTNSIDPIGFAYILDVIGRFYKDDEGLEALAAIEANNHGIATQSELQLHLGYTNFFIWQHWDTADVGKRNTTRIGWYTTRATRPLIITRYVRKVKTLDPNTGLPDYIINSPFTIKELRTFHTLDTLTEAEADPTNPDAHDDCIMAGCIGVHVAQTLHFDTNEDLDSARKRATAERYRKQQAAQNFQTRRDFNNTDCTIDEMENSGIYGERDN